jgi:hypothetical protein
MQIKPEAQNRQLVSPRFSSTSSIDLLDTGTGQFQFRVRALDGVGRPSHGLQVTCPVYVFELLSETKISIGEGTSRRLATRQNGHRNYGLFAI